MKSSTPAEITVVRIRQERIEFCIVGSSPMIFNAVSEKARHELLLPKGRKTAAERAENLKHIPIEEYRNSVYAHRGDDRSTRLFFPCGAFKKAMSNAALDMPGVKKAQIGRLVWIAERDIDIYGVPQLLMSVVRSADINRTPDIRTRAILPTWACKVAVSYVPPLIKSVTIGNLLAAAGLLIGVGDWRQEKGSGSFGQFDLVDEDDPRFLALVETGGRVAQDTALRDPVPYDLESEKMLTWFDGEVIKMRDAPLKKARKEKEAA